MEEKSELNNLLLQRDENKFANLKKIILIGASLFIVFLIAIGIVRNINSDKAQNSVKGENILPPEPAKEANALKGDDKNKDAIFEQVPIKDGANAKEQDKFDKIVSEIKQKNEATKSQQELDNLMPEQTSQPVIPKEQKIEESKKIEPKKVVEAKRPVEHKPVEHKTEQQPKEPKSIKQLVEQTDTPAQSNKVQPKVEPKKEEKPKVEKQVTAGAKGNYYIQIGAFSKAPSDKFLQSITKSGLNYKLHNTTINGKDVIKVLVGPYSSKNDANADVEKVKNEFKVNPFIIKL
ncbi:MAG: SPOR domain-containing protein [Campylobacterales bacterium]|nr:SPOR domain-containing protein [Campylobacterales bacterium]